MSTSFVEHASGDYSTLEYNTPTPLHSPGHGSRTPLPNKAGMEVAIGEGPQAVPDDPPEAIPDNKPKAINTDEALPFARTLPDENTSPGEPLKSAAEIRTERAWFWGHSRRSWIELGVVVVIIIIAAAVIGGVLGSRLGKSSNTDAGGASGSPTTSSSGTSASSTTDSDNKYIYSDSKLTATNFTDVTTGNNYRAVFFQDTTLALVGRIWDSQNDTWRTLDITDKLPQQQLLAGSPLTTTAKSIDSGQLHVWCVLKDNSLHDYYWDGEQNDPVEATWTEESTLGGGTQNIWPGSGLASVWERPLDETSNISSGSWILAFQNQTGEIAVLNDTGPNNVAIEKQSAAEGTSLAMDFEFDATGIVQIVMTYESNNGIIKASWPPSDNTSTLWYTGASNTNPKPIIQNVPSPSDELQLVQAPVTNANYLFLALVPNGTVVGTRYVKTFLPLPCVTFAGGPNANFTAVAATSNNFFYGIYNDKVYEYTINPDNLGEFSYSSVIYPP